MCLRLQDTARARVLTVYSKFMYACYNFHLKQPHEQHTLQSGTSELHLGECDEREVQGAGSVVKHAPDLNLVRKKGEK